MTRAFQLNTERLNTEGARNAGAMLVYAVFNRRCNSLGTRRAAAGSMVSAKFNKSDTIGSSGLGLTSKGVRKRFRVLSKVAIAAWF